MATTAAPIPEPATRSVGSSPTLRSLRAPRAPNVTPGSAMAPLSTVAGQGGGMASPITPWNAGNNLTRTQVNPVDPADTAASRGAMFTALKGLQTLPDRQQLALDALQLFDEQTDAGYQQRLREVGQRAAKLGRMGSGMTTSELSDVFVARERDRDAVKRGLANEAAGMQLDDQLSRLGAIGALNQQLFGQDAFKRGEVRSERDFQYGVGRDEDTHLLATLQTLLPLAYGGNPSDALLGASGGAQQGAGQSAAGVAQLIMEAIRRRTSGDQ